MANEFIAIPVGAGDSFYLKRGDKNLLFDGGKSVNKIETLIGTHIKKQKINILVCSHNDSDHAKGIIGFLKSSNLDCDEVWLPGSWCKRLQDLLYRPFEFYEELKELCVESKVDSLEKFNELFDDDDDDGYFQIENHFEESNDMNFELNVNDQVFNTSYYISHPSAAWWYFSTNNQLISNMMNLNKYKFFVDAFKAANRIREIAILATKKKKRIRWFEFIKDGKTSPTGGIPDFLIPLNSKELKYPKKENINALRYLGLSIANKESLVFYSPSTDGLENGVVFTADSDLVSCNMPNANSDPMLITIPHHGSKSNYKAYSKFTNQNNLYIRSDGSYAARPSSIYKKLPATNRWCTLCKGQASSLPVTFTDVSGAWSSSSITCCCK